MSGCGLNHPDAPADLPGSTVTELAIGGLRLHEPPSASTGEIATLHPGAVVVHKGRRCRRFCTDGERLIAAFGAYTGMLNADKAYRGWEAL